MRLLLLSESVNWQLDVIDSHEEISPNDIYLNSEVGTRKGDKIEFVTYLAFLESVNERGLKTGLTVRIELIINVRSGIAWIDWIGKGPNRHNNEERIPGYANLRQLLAQIAKQHKGIKRFAADRQSGMREKHPEFKQDNFRLSADRLRSEAVAGRKITANDELQIGQIDPEEDWEAAEDAFQIAKKIKIRPNRNKDVHIIARVGDTVIGGVFTATYEDEYDGEFYQTLDFDVVVDPQWQGYQRAGLRLIESVIQFARELDCHVVTAFVINSRLARILDSKFGFEGLDQNWDGRSVVMTKYL
jgi:predicted N-acetyltransferase YhbS